MNVMFDTSVLVAATVTDHLHHGVSRPWLEAASAGRIDLFVSCHSLAEFYRVLTSIKSSPQFTTQQVWRILNEKILQFAKIVELTEADYTECLQRLMQAHERGGIVFDAIIVQAALKAKVDHLLTLNDSHFTRLRSNHAGEVINPLTTQVP